MIKKLIHIIFISLISWTLSAQEEARLLTNSNEHSTYWINTVPIYNIPGVKKGDFYSHELEIRIPKDTITSFGNKVVKVKLKDIKILNVNNVPNGFSYSQRIVNNSDEDYIHLLLFIYGNLEGEITNNISIDMSVTFSVNNGKDIVRNNKINNIVFRKINQSESLETYRGEVGLKSLRYFPNQLANRTEVSFWSSKLQLVQFEVRDAIGNLKYKKQFTAKMGSNTISFSQDELPNGLYFYSIRTDNQILAKRLIVN